MSDFSVRTLDATDENMDSVNQFIHSMIPSDVEPSIIGQIDLAVEEIFVNIAHYAYHPEKGAAEITCGCTVEDGGPVLSVIFRDRGKPFDPLQREDPDISLSADERDIGGLGIFLTKKFMDSVNYSYKEGFNVLTIRKKLYKEISKN